MILYYSYNYQTCFYHIMMMFERLKYKNNANVNKILEYS